MGIGIIWGVVLPFVCRKTAKMSFTQMSRKTSVIEKWKSVPTAHSWAHEVKLEAGAVAQVLRKWGADTPGGAVYTLCALCKRSRCNICDERMCATGHRSIWPTNYSLTETQQGLRPPSPPSRPLCSTHVSPHSITLLTCPSNSQLHQWHICRNLIT